MSAFAGVGFCGGAVVLCAAMSADAVITLARTPSNCLFMTISLWTATLDLVAVLKGRATHSRAKTAIDTDYRADVSG
jgi:hypothetical protein